MEELTSRDGDGVVEAGFARHRRDGDDRLIEELEIGVGAYNRLKRRASRPSAT